ncbi:WXG100 family type VII secretion target [Bacillus sp. BK006]|jgi:WXG100 family type VII secretion target|uniref:WXG100 family type VII secretion target n=1 Tax=Priestia megaterium TaxID=1404 RepID=UPI00048AEFCA|nr:WXG100 family type VII secretion target [Bacillus sp. BK006]
MAGNRILVSPDELEKVAKQFKAASDQNQQASTKLSQTVSAMNSQWDGMTSERFFHDFEQSKKQMKQYTQLLEQVSTELKQIAQRFRQADNAR